MNKILLFLLILCMVVGNLNNVSAFSDDFNDGSISDWTLVNSWNANNYFATTTGNNVALNTATYNDSSLYTYWEVSLNSTVVNGCANGGLSGGYIEYQFESNGTSSKAIRLSNDGQTATHVQIRGESAYTDYYTPNNQRIKVTVSAEGSNYRVQVTNLTNLSVVNDQTIPISTTIINKDRLLLLTQINENCGGSIVGNFDDVFAGFSNPDLPSTGTINWGSDSYNLGDMGALDADLVNPDFETYGYRTIIYNPDGSVNRAWMFPEGDSSQNTFDISMSQLGTYTVKLQYFTDLFNYYDLDTDTTTVTYRSSSLGSAYFSGNYFNIGDIVFFNSTLNNINNSLYFYEVNIIRPNGRTYNSHNITANESYQFTTNEPGEWTGYLVAYPKSSPEDGSNSISDTMITYGSNVGVSWVSFNNTYYTRNSWARINYGIAANDFYDSHKMQIVDELGNMVFDRQIITQSGYFDYYFYAAGTYTVTIDRNWFALDWDLTGNEILASDVTEVTNTIAGGFTLGVTPTTVNCGQTVYFSAETPNIWNTSYFQIKNVSGTIMADISGQAGSWKTNQTGQFWVYLYDGGAIQDTGYFYVYGICTGYDVMNPDGSGGIKPKPYPQTDQATSNANLQNNLLYFMGLPIFWGMIIFIGALIIAAVNKAGSAIPYLAPGILLFEAVVGLLDPYSSFIIVGFAIVTVMYFIGNFVANRAGN